MIIDINAKIISSFDRVAKAAKKASSKALRSSGAYLRKVVQSGIKKGKIKDGEMIPSKPGTPPHYWQQPGLNFKKSILFGVDAENESVVVGAIAGRYGKLGQLHEFGGSKMNKVWDRETKKEISVLATYPARPFMAPGLAKSKDKISKFWEDSIK
ncbi:MAG: hypothetical protein WCR17_04515 [Candidatus Methanomethylophilaceae archaeon]